MPMRQRQHQELAATLSACLAAALTLAIHRDAHAQDAPPPAPRPAADAPAASQPAPLRGEYLQMADQTGMGQEQRASLARALRERDVAIQGFNAQNDSRLKQLQKGMMAARETHDRSALLALGKEHQSIEAARRGVAERYDQKILGLMSREQKQSWECFKLTRAMLKDLGRLSLTPAQGAEIRARAEKSAAALTGGDDKARNQMRAELRRSIEAEVLTEAQRDELAKSMERRADAPAGGAATAPRP